MRTPGKIGVGLTYVLGLELFLSLGLGVMGAPHPGAAEPDRAKDQAVAEDLTRLQGTWQLIFAKSDGKKTPEAQVKQIRVIIENDHHTVMFGDQVVVHKVKFTLDPTTSPKSTEDTLEQAPHKGKKIRGIYRVDGDSLTSCVGPIDGPRPTEFASMPGSGWTLRRYRRVKPVTDAAHVGSEDANDKEYKAFEGTWRFVSLEMGGKALPAETFKAARLICKGREFTSIDSGETSRGTYSVDVTQSPKTIDATFTDGPSKGHVLRGIYELKGDIYKVCMSLPGEARPNTFESKPGSRHVLEVLQREKP
jgi:uncharacterized protein (TIGR03067 family)